MRRLLPLFALAVAAVAFARGPEVVPLAPNEVPALLQAPAHGERVIMLWSLDCAYCEPNMQALAKLQRAHPDRIELVTVATDSIALQDQLIARLAVAGMQAYVSRAYTEASPARINFLIDPEWGGELPRTIVVRADGSRLAMSGELTATQLAQIASQ